MTDRNASLQSWLQLVSNLAIIAGLGIVIYELNQTKQIAHAQIIQNDFASHVSRYIATMGEDPRETLARAAFHPDELSEEDAVVLDAFYNIIATNWTNVQRTSELIDLDRPWKFVVQSTTRKYFTTEPGRRWLEAWMAAADLAYETEAISEVAREALGLEGGNYFRARYEVLLGRD